MSTKAFFEVLPDLVVEKNLHKLFAPSTINEVEFQKASNKLVFNIESPNLLPYYSKKKMREQIKTKLFNTAEVKIDFNISYALDEDYSVERITTEYKESIVDELQDNELMYYLLLKNSDWEISNDTLIIKNANNPLLEKSFGDIKLYISKLYKQRFNKQINCTLQLSDITDENFDETQKLKVYMAKSQAQQASQTAKPKQKPMDQLDNFNSRPQQPERKPRQKVNTEGLIYGRNCEGDVIEIYHIVDEIGEVCVQGQIIAMETREIRSEKTIIICDITDFTDTITFKLFVENADLAEILSQLQKGKFYKVKGVATLDKFDKEIALNSIRGIRIIPDFRSVREDTAEEKRVELHLHTKMSDMDSVVDIKEMISRAKAWGMPAVAITDHGCLQAFPIANHCIKKDDPFKIIYGVEAYFVDDLKHAVENDKGQSLDDEFVVFDIETTGFSPTTNKIIEIGAVKIVGGKVVDAYSTFVNPHCEIPKNIVELTKITDDYVKNAPSIETVLPEFLQFCEGVVMVAHNAEFDMSFIYSNAKAIGLDVQKTVVDTVAIARTLLPDLGNAKLGNIAKKLGVSLENHHRAVDDAKATSDIFLKFCERLKQQEIYTLTDLNKLCDASPDYIKKLPTYHGIILVKNEVGRINLNRLVSISHLDYFNRRPRMPKSLIQKYREGLILGSACEAGEIFQGIMREKDEVEMQKLVSFYDYLEIQPELNNEFMIRSEKHKATSREDLREYNRQIISLGEKYNKRVVATCDVHFMNPEDEVYRRIIMSYKGFKDADFQPPLYFRTTNEMLEEFAYLGQDKAYEVVVTNTRAIADEIEKISPVLPDKCPPEIENSDVELRQICYDKAHEIYGPNLHEVVVERLERELNSIINNGFAVMYIISQKLVWDSNDHGYLVGSRGSVGSSFAATMSGITEVNPLAPHYICPSCFYTDFDSEVVKSFAGSSGCDMPDADCPKCGTPLNKEGHDIPFETFLGFKGDKEPDIDLNFSGEYQAASHKYVEVLFGEGKAYRAGTIGTVADKTAFVYVLKYCETRALSKRKAEMKRLAAGCTGVKRTTGQHPGGIIVVPHDREIYEFCAIQRPANDVHTPIITTHYEYHSIDHNLLKLDILGHDDPTIIRRLEDITGISSDTIRLDDKDVMKLFHGTEVLGITPDDIGGIRLGSLGVPEFGTDFVIQMLVDAKPQNFSDLVRISGLSHGTDVWIGNAQTLIEEGKGTISTVICTRDDIMTYLIGKGLEKGLAFTIMESVRKGKGLTPEWEEEMIANDVPDWYVWSCKKIKYMFPKAHAAAYVMMAWRIAWYKVFWPLAYYTAFFSIRASSFSYDTMCFGKRQLEDNMKAISSKPKDMQTAKEQDTLKDMRIVQEMYARGFEFLPIDLTVVHDKNFQIIDNKIMPSLGVIEGLGEKAAESVVSAVKDGPFLSKDDFRKRTKVSQTITDKMSEFGLLGDIPESNQISIMDLLG
ncbi:MAG: PolC-type DNA polymerase III [Epulopiscium sp. Nele67-Bin004]|nr:MAG: PolC-type DNA polymerase III [Epulopiscium sp. Nele67-Bin004]